MTICLESVTRKVGRETHLEDISLKLEMGSINVVLGRTLAGKTTLLRILAGLDRPSAGRIWVNGRDVTHVSVRKRNVAMVYQQFVNYPSLTVYHNIAAPLKFGGVDKAEMDRKVKRAAEMLRIDNLLGRLPAELSGGQQQRLAIARALVKEAHLLLLDEPLVNLDYKLREELRVELQEIFKRREGIVVYTTTEPSEALMMGGDSVVLHEGRVLQAGKTPEIYHRPASAQVARIFSDPPLNLAEGEVDDQAARIGADIRLPKIAHLLRLPAGAYRFGVHAHHLFLQRRSADDIEIEAKVELAEISGSETFLHIRRRDLAWTVQEPGVHKYHNDADVRIFVNPGHFFAFDQTGALAAAPGDSSLAGPHQESGLSPTAPIAVTEKGV